MKKLLYIVLFSLLFLSGCEKNLSETAPESLFLMDGEQTAAGVRPGDGPKEFQKAYSNYQIQVAWNELESSYMTMSISEIPYKDEISTIIANLFIDGKPVTEQSVCDENQIEPDELHGLLSSTAYLQKHEVLYRYLIFDWSEGKITQIASEELNYNESFETPYAGS